jgi:FkbM family methyltransferase
MTVSLRQYARRFFWNFGVDVRPTRSARDIHDFIKERQINVVLDVGANVGQFGTLLRINGYKGEIVSFETLQQAFVALLVKTGQDQKWQVHNYALGEELGEVAINVFECSVFSSILNLTHFGTEYDKAAGVARIEVAQVRTLDEMFLTHAFDNILLKIDTQGYERQVLEGGRKMLGIVKGILMELPIVALYEGTWQFHEAVTFMARAGFVPAQFHPVNYLPDRISLLEIDCLSLRASLLG